MDPQSIGKLNAILTLGYERDITNFSSAFLCQKGNRQIQQPALACMIEDYRKHHLPRNHQTLPKLWWSSLPTSAAPTAGLLPFEDQQCLGNVHRTSHIETRVPSQHHIVKGEILIFLRMLIYLVLHIPKLHNSFLKTSYLNFFHIKSHRQLLIFI